RCWLGRDIFEVMPCLLVRPAFRNVVLKVIPWWSIMCRDKAGRRKPRPFEEKSMSREDDFDDIMDSDVTDSAQDDTSEPLLEDESGDGSTPEETEAVAPIAEAAESVDEEMPAPPRKSKAKKKKKAIAKPKVMAKKKTA